MRAAKTFAAWFALGGLYLALEGIWRGGWTHIAMLPIGGLCGLCVGAVNQIPRFYKSRMIWQAVLGALIITAIEFVSGCVVNLWLGLAVWDYTDRPLNVLGQICLPYTLLWVALTPFAIWCEDTLQWLLWAWDWLSGRKPVYPEIAPYSLKSIYWELITLR